MNKKDYPDFINDYYMYVTIAKGRSKRTADGYLTDIKVFFRYLIYISSEENIEFDKIEINKFSIENLKKVNLNKIYEYIYFLREERENGEKSIARKISSLKSLFRYLNKQVCLIDNDPTQNLELPSLKKSLPKFLTLDESLNLLDNLESNKSESIRDYCIITLFLNCGMRLSELVGLNISDIDFNEQTMRLLGKGNKERIIYLNSACINALQEYLKSREGSSVEPDALFLSRKNRRISRRRVEQIVEEALRKAGLSGKGISVHKLRHTAATLMYQHGKVDTLTLKEILGHKSIATTEIYTHLSSDILKKAAESSPLANIKKEKK